MVAQLCHSCAGEVEAREGWEFEVILCYLETLVSLTEVKTLGSNPPSVPLNHQMFVFFLNKKQNKQSLPMPRSQLPLASYNLKCNLILHA